MADSDPKSEHRATPLLPWMCMAGAILATLALAIWLVRVIPQLSAANAGSAAAKRVDVSTREPAVRASIVAGGVTVQRHLPTAAFTIAPGQSLDSRLPPGPFQARIEAIFRPHDSISARIGAEIQHGSLVVRREGETILADYAGPEPRKSLTSLPLMLSTRVQSLEFIFKSDGSGTSRFRALWQPESSPASLPLPVDDAMWAGAAALRGLAQTQRFNCAACHRSSNPSLQAILHVAPGPDLTQVGSRIRPRWIRQWLDDPQIMKPGARMPRLLHSVPVDDEAAEDLTHFLASLGGPLNEPSVDADENLLRTGEILYAQVGCVACHGPPALLAGSASVPGLYGEYQSIGRIAEKTTVAALAAYLIDPVSRHPAGLMPAMNLESIEARALAAYLIAQTAPAEPAFELSTFDVDTARAQRGRSVFAQLGCASCHEVRIDDSAILSSLAAPSLESISTSLAAAPSSHGTCLLPDDSFDGPHFEIAENKRREISEYLLSLDGQRSHDVPIDQLGATLVRLNCLACHEFHDVGGAEPLVARLFSVTGEVDLGDEGRLPPDLSHAGGRLQSQWVRRVLEDGDRARQYMATRMPQFGRQNVHRLPEWLMAADGADDADPDVPDFTVEDAAEGRTLVGQNGLGCIQCHGIAGQPATGTPGPDLVQMVERLRYDHFLAWVAQPQMVRRGTRMPSFFNEGYSGLTEIDGGAAERQIPDIWAYLSQGERLSLPEGIVAPESYDLKVGDEPIVFRTFMHDAGVRAIACGFPEGIHCVFDADQCRIAAVWTGEFLNAAGAWAQRGGSETNPAGTAWQAPKEPLISIAQSGSSQPVQRQFLGYRFDAQRRPIFLYDLMAGETRVSVREQPIPVKDNGAAWLRIVLQLQGPPGTTLAIQQPTAGAVAYLVTLDGSGHAETEARVIW